MTGPARFITPARHPTDDPLELSKQLDEIASGVQQLAFQQTYIQATEPNIANSKIVLWRDTATARSYLVIRLRDIQYKIELGAAAVPPVTTGSLDYSFRWPHILGADTHILPGGISLDRGIALTSAVVTGLEVYFEVAPSTSLTLEIHDSPASFSADGAAATLVVTANRGADFSLSKAITLGNLMFLKLSSGGPDSAEFLMHGRVIYNLV